MSHETAAPEPRATSALPQRQWVHLPLLHCRHYVRNYFDLFQDLLARIYSAGNVSQDVIVEPGDTVGEALNLTEQKVAQALTQPDGNAESVFLRLLRTILEDQGATPEDANSAVISIDLVLKNTQLPTFEQKADELAKALELLSTMKIIAVTSEQIDKLLGAFRSIGKLVADMIDFEFPELVNYRQNLFWNPERYLLITGPYRAVLSSDPKDVLTCSFANDRITIEIKFESLEIDETADFEFFKVKEKNNGKTVTKEKHEMLMSAVGSLVFNDVRIRVLLNDNLAAPTEYSWAPGHDVRRAEWTAPSVVISVGSVDLDLAANAATVLLSFLEGSWGSVQSLEEEVEEAILDSVNNLKEIAGLADIARDYISPIVQRLIPVGHALSSIRIAKPFEGFGRVMDNATLPTLDKTRALGPGNVVVAQYDPVTHIEFERLKTIYETRAVSIRNEQPDPPEMEPESFDDGFRIPDNLDEVDPPEGTWTWPSMSGGGLMQLDLNNLNDRAVALGILQRAPDLSARTRAIAALSVEGLSTRTISAVRQEDVDLSAGTVFGRNVDAATIVLLRAVQEEAVKSGAGSYLFSYGGFSASEYLVESELRTAQTQVLKMVTWGGLPGSSGPTQEQVFVPGFADGIWDADYASKAPLRTSRGAAHDPGWVGLSTNCVVATSLYRKLKEQNWFTHSGNTRAGTEKFVYDLQDCIDVVADFSGDAPDDAPALAIHGLRIVIRPERGTPAEYRVDLRLRLKPWIHGHGCLPDDAVSHVWESLDCIEGMTGGQVPLNTRLRQLEFRDFVVLRADFTDPARDIQIVQLTELSGTTTGASKAGTHIRAAVAHWFPTVPEPPILYNSFRAVGGETRDYVAQDGWLCLYRRYPFPDLSNLDIG